MLQQAGYIPDVLSGLHALQVLKLFANKLTGGIPKKLCRLARLRLLELSGNELNGVIPTELGELCELRVLELRDNKLLGGIPKQLGRLLRLERLDLGGNDLDGCIPEEIGKLTRLRLLFLDSNRLSGFVPRELGGLDDLKSCMLQNNELCGLWDVRRPSNQQDRSSPGDDKEVPWELADLIRVLERAMRRRWTGGMNGNPWQYPPATVVNGGSPATRDFFTSAFAEGSSVVERPLKVVLIGKETVGKTSLRQSMRQKEPCPTVDVLAASTVHIDVEDLEIIGERIRVFDCAGQEAYHASLQLFLTQYALYLLVVDMERAVENVEKNAQDPLGELGVLQWVRSLAYRVPKAAVVLVGTKCDRVETTLSHSSSVRLEAAAAAIEPKIRNWITSWSTQAAARAHGVAASYVTWMRPEDTPPPEICLEPGMSLVSLAKSSCRPQVDGGSGWSCDVNEPGLLGRILRDPGGIKRAVSMRLPRSWQRALDFLDNYAEGCRRVDGRTSPSRVVLCRFEHDGLEVYVFYRIDQDSAGCLTAAFCTSRDASNDFNVAKLLPVSTPHRGRAGFRGIAMTELREEWRKQTADDGPLDGALLLRAGEGGLVVCGSFVFFDVDWLAQVLKPLLSHKPIFSEGRTLLGEIEVRRSPMLERFEEKGILEPALAKELWGEKTAPHVLGTLESAGLAFPLAGDREDGLVVLLRLPELRPAPVGVQIEQSRFELDRDGKRNGQIKAVCTFWGGVPPGFIERLLTKCCRLGSCNLFWRRGVFVESELFSAIFEYVESEGSVGELSLDVFGDCTTANPWGAISAGVSVVIGMLLEFPGMHSTANLECQRHPTSSDFSRRDAGARVDCSQQSSRGKRGIPIDLSQSQEWSPLIRSVDGCPSCRPRDKDLARLLLLYVPLADCRLDLQGFRSKFDAAVAGGSEILSEWDEASAALRKATAMAKRDEDEADTKRLNDEAGTKRLEDEAERRRLEGEAESKRLEDEAEAKRLGDSQEAEDTLWSNVQKGCGTLAGAFFAAFVAFAAVDNPETTLWGVFLALAAVSALVGIGIFGIRRRVEARRATTTGLPGIP
ncbi:unnamed protein product [Scytosiphon promiscuus]